MDAQKGTHQIKIVPSAALVPHGVLQVGFGHWFALPFTASTIGTMIILSPLSSTCCADNGVSHCWSRRISYCPLWIYALPRPVAYRDLISACRSVIVYSQGNKNLLSKKSRTVTGSLNRREMGACFDDSSRSGSGIRGMMASRTLLVVKPNQYSTLQKHSPFFL